MRRSFFILFSFLVLLLSLAHGRQPETFSRNDGHRPRIGLVLGGGGAKGSAHIGVLKYLEEQGIPIDYVVGTSMGSIIGGLYALGYTPDEMTEIIRSIDWSYLMSNRVEASSLSAKERRLRSNYRYQVPFNLSDANFTLSSSYNLRSAIMGSLPSSFIGGSKVTNLLNSLCVGYQDSISFDSLPIPYACVATNIATGEGVVIRSGCLPMAIRASMAIPGVFDPAMIDGKLLIDGGMANNFPADVCRAMGADIIIGVEVAAELESNPEKLQSLSQIANQLLQISVSANKRENRDLCDIYIRPDMTGYNMMSFNSSAIDTLVHRGYEMAQNCSTKVAELREHISHYGQPAQRLSRAPAYRIGDEPFFLADIDFNGLTYEERKWLIKTAGLDLGMTNTTAINTAMQTIRGTGTVTNIVYSLSLMQCPSDTTGVKCYKLTADLTAAKPHFVGIGIRFDEEENAAILLGLGINQRRISGLKTMISGRLNANPMFRAHLSYEGFRVATLNFDYKVSENNYRLYYHRKQEGAANRLENLMRFYLSEFQSRYFNLALGVSNQMISYLQTTSTKNIRAYDFVNKYYGGFASVSFDNRNRTSLADYGFFFNVRGSIYVSHHDAHHHCGSGFGDVMLTYRGIHRIFIDELTGAPQFYGRLTSTSRHYNSDFQTLFGGSLANRHYMGQLPFIGVTHPHVVFNDAGVLRYDIRYSFSKNHSVALLANVIGGTTEDMFSSKPIESAQAYYGVGLQYAMRTFLGPIAANIHWSSLNYKWGLSVSIGYDI